MSTQQKRSIGVRLAIRKEGPVVNAYVAEEETMAGAFIIGSLDIGLAERPAIWDRWKALMTDAMAMIVEEKFGQKPDMIERRAPEHERSGSA